jgi:hypothetical protein
LRDDLLARSGSFVCAVVRVQFSQRRNALAAASSVLLSAEPVRTTSETNQRSPVVANESTAMPRGGVLDEFVEIAPYRNAILVRTLRQTGARNSRCGLALGTAAIQYSDHLLLALLD